VEKGRRSLGGADPDDKKKNSLGPVFFFFFFCLDRAYYFTDLDHGFSKCPLGMQRMLTLQFADVSEQPLLDFSSQIQIRFYFPLFAFFFFFFQAEMADLSLFRNERVPPNCSENVDEAGISCFCGLLGSNADDPGIPRGGGGANRGMWAG
jgi:hypothetical protein